MRNCSQSRVSKVLPPAKLPFALIFPSSEVAAAVQARRREWQFVIEIQNRPRACHFFPLLFSTLGQTGDLEEGLGREAVGVLTFAVGGISGL